MYSHLSGTGHPILERKKFHGLFGNNKVLIRLFFLTNIHVTKLQLELPTDPDSLALVCGQSRSFEQESEGPCFRQAVDSFHTVRW